MQTKLEKIIGALNKELDAEHRIRSGEAIIRKGNQIIIPEMMEPEAAAKAILEYVKSQREEVNKIISVECHPDDGLANFDRAISETFGGLVGRETSYFMGLFKDPSQSKSIRVGWRKKITVPYGNVAIPGLPIHMHVTTSLNEDDPMRSKMTLDITYERRYEPIIEMIEEKTREYLRNHSIFRGQAINSKFEFINPKSNLTDKLVYSEKEHDFLNANLFNVIEHTDDVRKKGIPLKRTILLRGGYGTGKTLTANYAAELCMENGWTFVNVIATDKGAQEIVNALQFAKKYEPCLVFFEDVDAVTSGRRDKAINDVLNTVDGILSKSDEVLTILTTNNVDVIERALLRPGRIDEVIELGTLDETSIIGLVRAYVGENLEGELDAKPLLEAAEGYTPSFVAEATKHAVLFAIARDGADAKITNADVLKGLEVLRPQYKMMAGAQVIEAPQFENIVEEIVDARVEPLLNKAFSTFEAKLNPRVLLQVEED